MTTRTAAEALEQMPAPYSNATAEGYGDWCAAMLSWALHWQDVIRAALATPQPLTDAQIVEIRDDHLPSQGEPFDCIAFARAVLRATQSNRMVDDWKAAAKYSADCHAAEAEREFSQRQFESPAQSAPMQEPVSDVLRAFASKNPLAAPPPDEARELLVELFDEWVDDDDQSELTQRVRAYLEKHK